MGITPPQINSLTMSVKNELLSQCLDLAKQLMKNNQKATINIFKPEFSVEPENNDEEEAIETIVNESDIFPCESCSKIFNFNKDMCDVCKIAIAEREHILLPNSYQCDICKRSFKTKTQFKQHKLCSYKENSFSNICEVCNKLWTKKDDFEYHMQQKYCRQSNT